MRGSVLVLSTVTAIFCVTVCNCRHILSVDNERATRKEFQYGRIEALLPAVVDEILNEELAWFAANVNPANFQCTKTSPTDPADWSTTDPKVALTHIFCGQINQKGKAEGYHSRPNNRDPVCARANNLVDGSSTYPLKCYRKIEVLQYIDGMRDKWIARDPGTYCFFPSAWDIGETVNVLVNIYKRCQNSRDTDKICYQNYPHPDGGTFGIVLFVAPVNGKEAINSAFPVPKSMTMPCKKYCQG